MNRSAASEPSEEVAVIGMALRFPKARTVEQYWQNLRDGREAVSFFSDEELRAEGYSQALLDDPALVKAAAVLEDIELFDASFFGFTPREAEITDPQQRVFLECAWEALESAGYNAEGYAGRVGVYAGAGMSTYLLNNLMANTELAKLIGNARAIMGNDVNYLTTWVSYKLNLKGPSLTVQTACSTSLVAVHLACQSLLNGECDMALAGGVNIRVPQKAGYLYREGGINSPDGHCRPFDAAAAGTIGGNGAGIVVLKRLADALEDGDDVQAVIKGSAINNDGSVRIGYTAPSVGGQAAVIAEAHSMAGTDSGTITYVEAHGTGTALGDPIEIAALTQAFRLSTRKKGFCAVGSVKGNLGHLDAAAGVAGLIKTVLALRHKLIPPSLHFERPNPKIDFANSPFYVNTTLREWEAGEGGVRRAGVSSLGIGGTNAHVVLEEAPPAEDSSPPKPWQLMVLSAKTGPALETATANLARAVKGRADLNPADVAYTLQVGRRAFAHRRAVVCRDLEDAAAALGGPDAKRVLTGVHEGGERPVGFMFPGQGSQYVNMGLGLYRHEPAFRECVDECAELLGPQLGSDLREVLFPAEDRREWAGAQLQQTRLTQPALFVVEYALTKLLAAWGVRPSVMIGHSVGEYVAACVAGVFTLEEGLRLVAARGRLMQELPPGAMLAVPLTEPEVEALLDERLSVAAVNGPARCVVSGPPDALGEMEERLRKQGVTGRRLQTSHAFHSAMMEPITGPFTELFKGVSLRAPRTPYVSNVTGTWITAGEATDPRYWARHLRQAVRFGDGLALLLKEAGGVLLEVGPGQVLSNLARPQLPKSGEHMTLPTLRQPADEGPDEKFILDTLGRLWLAGCPVSWEGLHDGERRRRVQLPTSPFERRPYWIIPSWKTAMKQRLEEQEHAGNGKPAQPATPPPTPEPAPALAPQAASAPEPARRERIRAKLGGLIKALTGADSDEIDPGATIFELGVDSLLLIQVGQRIEDEFKLKVPFRLFFEELSTLGALVEYLDLNVPAEALPPAPAPPPSAAGEPPAHAPLQTPPAEPAPALHAEPAGAGVQPPPPSGVMESIIRQQLQLMAQQLEVLRNGHAAAGAQAPAGLTPAPAPAALVPAAPAANGSPRADAPKVAPPEREAGGAGSLPAEGRAAEGRAGREVFVPHKPIRTEPKGALSARQQKHLDDLTARYTERTRESKRHAQAHRPVFADSRNSLMFRSVWKEMAYPIVARRSSGSRLWDIDGNGYVDLTMGFGVNLFGHSPDFIVEALQTQLAEGMQIGPQSYLAGRVAALIGELTGAERVVFCNSGTEAVMAAVRIARTVTRRNKIALFAGAYHGTYDGTLARAVTAGGARRPVPVAPGIPQHMVEDVLVLDYDSPESLEALRANAHELAAVLVEPVQSRRPALQPREFLHEVRRLTAEAGVALIFDEIITGFRIHPGGAQAWFGVEADLATYGKVIGGGMPIGVVAGKARYLDAIDGGMWRFGDDSYPPSTQTFYTGTFCKHPLVMAAAHAVLNRLKEGGPLIQQRLNERTAGLAAGLNDYFARDDVPMRVEHFGSLFHFAHTEEAKFPELLTFHLIEKGVYVWEGGTRFLSTAHTDEDVERVVSAIKESVEQLREGGFIRAAAGERPAAPPPGAAERDSAPGGAPAPGDGPGGVRAVPLTEAQRQLWILTQMGEEVSRAYNESVTLRMSGPLDASVLRDAIQKVVDRHEGLRTTFAPEGDVQRIHPAMKLDLPFFDFSGLEEGEREAQVAARMRLETGQAFDLVRGPLLRACLIKVGAESHLLVLTGHHLVTDSRSFGVLIGELKIIYSAGCQGLAYELPEPMPYSEYARGELSRTEHPDMAASEAYWRRQFDGAPAALELPADRPRPPVQTYTGARHCLKLEASLGRELKAFSARQGVTLYVTMLAGFKTLLSQLSGSKDVVVGINAAAEKAMGNRSLIGFRLHPLALRSQVEDGQTFAQYLASVRTLLLDAYEHQDFPLVRLAKELRLRSGSRQQSLVSAAFNLDRSNSEIAFHGLRAEVVSNATGSAKLDVYLNVTDAGGEMLLECDYNSDLFDAATIEGWLGHLQAILKALVADPQLRIADLPRPPAPRQPRPEGAGPASPLYESSNLTSLQLLIWAGQKMNPGVPLYTNATYYIIPDEVELPHFRRAFQALLDRSDALRTVFEEDGAGVPQQRVVEGMRHEVEVVDLSAAGAGAHAALQSWMVERTRRPFDLTARAFDTALVRLGGGEYAWYINLHHVISDAWSATLMVRYQSEYYALSLAGRLGEAPKLPPYGEFVEGERARVGSPAHLEAKAYWERKLSQEIEPLTFYGRRPAGKTTRVERISYDLGPERTAGLKEAARRFPGMSEDARLLNVFAALLCGYLHRVTGARAVSLGVPFHNRLSRSSKETVGLFIQIFPLLVTVDEEETVASLVGKVSAEFFDAFRHREYPVANPNQGRVYDVMLDFINAALLPTFRGMPLSDGGWIHPGHGEQALNVQIQDFGARGSLALEIDMSCDIFDEGERRRAVGHFVRMLDSFLREPARPVGALDLLPAEEERRLLVDFNRTAKAVADPRDFISLFEAEAEKAPGRAAVACGGEELTYGELNARADQLARRLGALGVRRDVVVALLFPRGVDLLVSILAVFKAGGAYLPLDPYAPPARLRQVLGQSGTRLALAAPGLMQELRQASEGMPTDEGPRLVRLDELAGGEEPAAGRARGARPADLSYVIYTSGSTGLPKGAMIEQAGMLNHLYAKVEELRLTQADTVAQTASQSFDISVWQFLAPLLVGGRVLIVDDETAHDPRRLLALAETGEVTILETVPSMLRGMLEEVNGGGGRPPLPALRWMIVTGEALPPDLCQQWLGSYPSVPLLNAYGPTECSDDVTHFVVREAPASHELRVPIGTPLRNTRLYILDRRLRPVPLGVAAELYVGGAGVGRGYLNDPRRTAEVFVPDPFAAEPGARLYKTGDLARQRPDGAIEFLGRVDHQVKIRGFRIELGDIEATLNLHPEVRQSVVLAWEEAPGDKRLAAYVVASQERAPTPRELRAFLKVRLPEYMVPSAFVTLDELPLTANGKVNRQALPPPGEARAGVEEEFAPPSGFAEEALAQIWAEVLGVERVGAHDNFFELGGDSILGIRVASKANQVGLRLTPMQLFQHQTIAELAQVAGAARAVVAEQGTVEGPAPLTPIQHWFFEHEVVNRHHWNQALLLRARAGLDAAVLEKAVAQLLRHHDALRMRFNEGAGGWRQHNEGPGAAAPFTQVDLSLVAEAELKAAIERAAAQAQASLNLCEGPLLRVVLMKAGGGRPDRLLIVIHHLVVDGVSWRILLEDLETLYTRAGRADALPPKTTSFKYWAERLRRHADSGALDEERAYWLEQASRPAPPLPLDYEGGLNTRDSAEAVTVSLSAEETRSLLQEVPKARHTQIDDLLLTALVQVFARWTKEPRLLVALEGHGREELFEEVDLSRTVGFFTTTYPAVLEIGDEGDAGGALKEVKSQLRRIPRRGIGYGLLRYLSGDEATRGRLAEARQPDVVFNYLGQTDQSLPESAPFQLAAESSGPSTSRLGRRPRLLELNAVVAGGRLRVDWVYSRNSHRRETISRLAQGYAEALRALVAHCLSPEEGSYDPADFAEFKWTQADLDAITAVIGKTGT